MLEDSQNKDFVNGYSHIICVVVSESIAFIVYPLIF